MGKEKENSELLRLVQDIEFINFINGMEYNVFMVDSKLYPTVFYIILN